MKRKRRDTCWHTCHQSREVCFEPLISLFEFQLLMLLDTFSFVNFCLLHNNTINVVKINYWQIVCINRPTGACIYVCKVKMSGNIYRSKLPNCKYDSWINMLMQTISSRAAFTSKDLQRLIWCWKNPNGNQFAGFRLQVSKNLFIYLLMKFCTHFPHHFPSIFWPIPFLTFQHMESRS